MLLFFYNPWSWSVSLVFWRLAGDGGWRSWDNGKTGLGCLSVGVWDWGGGFEPCSEGWVYWFGMGGLTDGLTDGLCKRRFVLSVLVWSRLC